MRVKSMSAILVAMVLAASPAPAQQAQPNCPADAVPLPAELSGWSSRTGLTAAPDAAGLAGTTLAIGKAVDLALLPTPSVRYALRPENPGGSVSNGGLVGFTVDRPGTYRIALGSAAWIDVVRDGASETSVAHGRGPACSGVRKMVDFTLQPGSYVLQIAGNGSPSLPVMIARLP
jgi:hypothetical protein